MVDCHPNQHVIIYYAIYTSVGPFKIQSDGLEKFQSAPQKVKEASVRDILCNVRGNRICIGYETIIMFPGQWDGISCYSNNQLLFLLSYKPMHLKILHIKIV